MRNKKFFFFVLAGLLSVTFAIPVVADGRPSLALNPEDVPGWWLYTEGEIPGWNFTYSSENVNLTTWY